VGEYVAKVQKRQAEKYQQKYEECEMNRQLTMHESFLRMGHMKKLKQELILSSTPSSSQSLNRQRSISMDGYDIQDSGMCLYNAVYDSENDHADANSSIASSSVSSITSVRSFVTDDVSPTVRFESIPHKTFVRHNLSKDDSSEENMERRKRSMSDGDVKFSAWPSFSLGRQKDQLSTLPESNAAKHDDSAEEKMRKRLGPCVSCTNSSNDYNGNKRGEGKSAAENDKNKHNFSSVASLKPSFFGRMGMKSDCQEEGKATRKRIVKLF